MKKLTQILSLDFAANFLSEEDKDGKNLNVQGDRIVRFIPTDDLLQISKSVKGVFVENTNCVQLFLPLIFENNLVNGSILNNFPAELKFYISLTNAEKFAYAGLNPKSGGNKLLYLTPKNTSKDYVFQNKNIQSKPCSKGNVITNDDLVVNLPADISRDLLINLVGSDVQNLENVKFEIGGIQRVISLKSNFSELHNLLTAFTGKKTAVKVFNSANDTLIKEFTDVFVTETLLPSDVIGIVNIPKSALKINEPDYSKYDNLNHFVAHFPGIKTKLEIEISVNSFENSDKLFLDNKSISYTISNHPLLGNWKKVSCSVDNYFIYLNKQKAITLKTGNKNYKLPVNPILTYDSKVNKSIINITKNMN